MHDLQVCHLQERVKQKAPSPYCNGAKPLGPAPLTLRQTLRAHAARVTAAHGRWLLSEDDAVVRHARVVLCLLDCATTPALSYQGRPVTTVVIARNSSRARWTLSRKTSSMIMSA